MPNYTKIAASALRSIEKAGQAIPISRNRPTVDEITGAPTDPEDPTTGSLAAVVLIRYKGSLLDSYDDTFKRALVRGKAKIIIAAANGAPFVPEADDELTFDSRTWRVVGVSTLSPAGIPVIHFLGVVS